jgi:hypothetical protein
VIRVLVTNNDSPNEGYDWLVDTFGGRWIKTSYNGNIRKRFAAVGHLYDEALDAFIFPKPSETWILNSQTLDWEPPIPKPEGINHIWNEESQVWEEITIDENPDL